MSKKITQLPEATSLADTDIIPVVTDPAGTPTNKKITRANLLAGLIGAIVYRGTLDASAGTYPSTPHNGDYYLISVAGTISGTTYGIGDWAVYNGAGWEKIDNQSGVAGPTVTNYTDDHTVTLAQFGNVLTMNHATLEKTFTFPALSSTQIGKTITIVKKGAGKVKIQLFTDQSVDGGATAGTVYNDQATETNVAIVLQVISTTELVICGFDGTWTIS